MRGGGGCSIGGALVRTTPQQRLIERAGAVARQVQRDVEIARLAHSGDNRLARLRIQQAAELIAADFDACDGVVAAHPHLAEAQLA